MSEERRACILIVAGRALMRTPPDLMLVDVAMPYVDGLDFVAALKADTSVPDVPAVFITAHDDVAGRAHALGVPSLRKPFTVEQLLAVVRRELQLRPPRRRARLDYLSTST